MKGNYASLSDFSERLRSWLGHLTVGKGRAYRRGRRAAVILLIVLLICAILGGIVRAAAAPTALSVCGIHTKGEVQALILRVAGEEIGGEYRDYCTSVYSADGSVSSVSVDATAVNAVTARVVERLEEELSRFSVTSELPLGDLILPTFFSGRGPALRVHSTVYAAVSGEVRSSLADAGINQTLHTLKLEIKVNLTVVCMGKEEAFEVTSLLPLAEALVVGSTPGGLMVGGVN